MEMPQDGEICSVVFLCKNGRRSDNICRIFPVVESLIFIAIFKKEMMEI